MFSCRSSQCENEALVGQTFETLGIMVAANKGKRHTPVMVANNALDAMELQGRLNEFLKRAYPDQPAVRHDIHSRIKIVDIQSVADLTENQIKSVWIDWTEGEVLESPPVEAQDHVIWADQTLEGLAIPLRDQPNGYAASLLQAVSLLLQGPETSGLVKSNNGQGPYVQKSSSSLDYFSKIFQAIRTITRSA